MLRDLLQCHPDRVTQSRHNTGVTLLEHFVDLVDAFPRPGWRARYGMRHVVVGTSRLVDLVLLSFLYWQPHLARQLFDLTARRVPAICHVSDIDVTPDECRILAGELGAPSMASRVSNF